MKAEFYLPNDYPNEPRLRDLPRTPRNWARLAVLAFIRLYQKTISRGLPEGTCRFYPSCSHYGYQAIYKYGVLKGLPMATWRVLRCNPFNDGGYDPVSISYLSGDDEKNRRGLQQFLGLLQVGAKKKYKSSKADAPFFGVRHTGGIRRQDDSRTKSCRNGSP